MRPSIGAWPMSPRGRKSRPQQHQPTIAVGDVHPDFSQAARVARESYESGVAALRPGRRFGDVVQAMEKPVRMARGWHVHPWVHSLNPFGLVSGMPDPSPVLSTAGSYGRVGGIPEAGEEVVLRPGMTFAFEPNCGIGRRIVNLGGTVVGGEDAPHELNELATHLIRV